MKFEVLAGVSRSFLSFDSTKIIVGQCSLPLANFSLQLLSHSHPLYQRHLRMFTLKVTGDVSLKY